MTCRKAVVNLCLNCDDECMRIESSERVTKAKNIIFEYCTTLQGTA